MINPDINRFLGTLLYPVTDPELIFDDSFDTFFAGLPYEFINARKAQEVKKCKDKVFANAVKFMTRRYFVDSYDQIYQYMERWYLGQTVWRKEVDKGNTCISVYDIVFDHLSRLSRSMISKLDGQIIYKYWETTGDAELLGGFAGNDKLHLFRALNQMLPMDILAAIFVLDNPDANEALNSFYGHISITDLPLERVLGKGVAENHLHMGAATCFFTIWEDFMRPDNPVTQLKKNLPVKSPGAPKESVLFFYVLLARCIRLYLCLIVFMIVESMIDFQSLNTFFLRNRFRTVISSYVAVKRAMMISWNPIWRLRGELSDNIGENSEFVLQNNIFSRLTEPHFLLKTLKKLDEKEAKTCDFLKRLFLYYLRLKHGIFHMMVQEKTIFGLDYFQFYYKSASGLNNAAIKIGIIDPVNNVAFRERQIRSQLSCRHIHCVEFRTSFWDTVSKARKFVSSFLRAYYKILKEDYCAYDPYTEKLCPIRPLPRVGIVCHFLKSSQEMPDVCFYSEEDTIQAYGVLHEKYKRQLEIFKQLRDPAAYPGIDHYLVGIDVASVESGVPTWVFRDIYENARDAKSEPFMQNNRRPFQSLGFTFHAGEDYRHLLSGLRRVYEVVHFLKFHAGDRIGHGLALGVLAEDWCAEHPNVILPRIEALENYLWAYHMLSNYPSKQDTGNFLYLERQIQRLSKEIFLSNWQQRGGRKPSHISTADLLESYELLFEKDFHSKLCGNACKEEKPEECPLLHCNSINADYILRAYHCYHFTMRMNEPIHYHLSSQEILIIKELQSILQQYISEHGIIVEVNPTSNIVIGHMDTIHEHPLYQISSYRCDYKDIMVCVNSDDPSVFQTNTANEFGIAYMGMVERGIGREACLEWIDRLRENGMNGSFIRQAESDVAMLEELKELISVL